MKLCFGLAGLLMVGSLLDAQDLSASQTARFVKVLLDSSHVSSLTCADPGMKDALEGAGIRLDGSAPAIFCNNPGLARMAAGSGKLVIGSRRDMAAHAAIVVTGEGGKPKFLVNPAVLRKSRVQLGDAILRLAEQH
nr:hypothetical protein [uncultured Holophaga sp.]